MDSFDKQPKCKKMDMRFGTWNVRCMYRANLLMTAVKKTSKYKLDSVGGSTEYQMGQWRHKTSRRIYIFIWKGE
jgi:hypothetical protein